MPLPIRLTALVLAAVFVVSAVTKARDLPATTRELESLRIRRATVVTPLLVPLELAVAVALLLFPAWGAMAAFALLAAFTVVLVGVVRSGRAASCRCFGALSTGPVSWRTITRNLALMAMAGLVTVF